VEYDNLKAFTSMPVQLARGQANVIEKYRSKDKFLGSEIPPKTLGVGGRIVRVLTSLAGLTDCIF
jgi:hypothetical protein